MTGADCAVRRAWSVATFVLAGVGLSWLAWGCAGLSPQPSPTPSAEPFVNPYENMLRDYFVHDLSAGGHFGQPCSACHHSDPSAAGRACPSCHDREEALFNEEFGVVVPVLKDAMHSGVLESGKQGCRTCHDITTGVATAEGLWDCSFCHQALDDF